MTDHYTRVEQLLRPEKQTCRSRKTAQYWSIPGLGGDSGEEQTPAAPAADQETEEVFDELDVLPVVTKDLYRLRAAGRARIKIGPAVELIEVRELAFMFNTSVYRLRYMLNALQMKYIILGSCRYVNRVALERVLYYLSRPGGPGFAGPGTSVKRRARWKQGGMEVKTTVNLEDVAQMETPEFVFQVTGARPKAGRQHLQIPGMPEPAAPIEEGIHATA